MWWWQESRGVWEYLPNGDIIIHDFILALLLRITVIVKLGEKMRKWVTITTFQRIRNDIEIDWYGRELSINLVRSSLEALIN